MSVEANEVSGLSGSGGRRYARAGRPARHLYAPTTTTSSATLPHATDAAITTTSETPPCSAPPAAAEYCLIPKSLLYFELRQESVLRALPGLHVA